MNTLVSVNFNSSEFFGGSEEPKKTKFKTTHNLPMRQGSHCFAGLPGVPSSGHGGSGAQALL